MSNIDLADYEGVDLTTIPADEARDVIQAINADAFESFAAAREAADAQARAVGATAEREAAEAATPEGQIRAEAMASLARERQRTEDAEAARALLRERANRQGLNLLLEHHTDEEVLQLVGLAPAAPETPNDRRIREENGLWSRAQAGDSAARAQLAALEHRKAVERLDQGWFQLTGWERKREAERLGLSYDDHEAQMQQRFANRRTY